MSEFLLNKGYALQLPNNYVEIDRDEMEYVDGGGWSIYTFAKSLNNLSALFGRYISPSRAWAFSGAGVGLSFAWGYWTTVSVVGAKVAQGVAAVASVLSGPLGIALAVAAGLGTVGLIAYMGTGVRF